MRLVLLRLGTRVTAGSLLQRAGLLSILLQRLACYWLVSVDGLSVKSLNVGPYLLLRWDHVSGLLLIDKAARRILRRIVSQSLLLLLFDAKWFLSLNLMWHCDSWLRGNGCLRCHGVALGLNVALKWDTCFVLALDWLQILLSFLV